MTTSTLPREEVFPGYMLTERLGSGGYAEVWRARAPGGIDKAVKIVYGYYDDQLASQEMKAMERIKDVRHPFVLSLERFEVVDGRLAILTELADMSLEQRAQQCRAQGLPGIPREELLRYIADTAEALDYLAQRHSLQHLDIKPANLLISGEHVKVADFGLVKELASRTQNSMVAGMTPTYSAPEMFDDAPSPHSDQYSLAIVYQEMLTGTLPFPGRTAAQLANQHLRSQPQLAGLAEIDRRAVAKALAKAPAERFPSCRAFVQALRETADATIDRPTAGQPSSETASAPAQAPFHGSVTTAPRFARPQVPATPAHEALNTQPTDTHGRADIDTKHEHSTPARSRPVESIDDIAVPEISSEFEINPPTLYVAAGGVGIRILGRLHELLANNDRAAQTKTAVEMLAIDTDRDEIRAACSSSHATPLPSSETLLLPLRLPQEYRTSSKQNLEWLSHRWLYNIPRSLETRSYRPLGRLALVDHLDKTLVQIDRRLERLMSDATSSDQQSPPPNVRVIIVAGMGGGTGGGMAIDLANAVRSRAQAKGSNVQVQGVFVCTCLGSPTASPLSVANSYALLNELKYVSQFGNQGNLSDATRLPSLESTQRPFDLVYCVPAKHHTDESSDDALGAIAHQLALRQTDGLRQAIQCCQTVATPQELASDQPLVLRTFGSASLTGPQQNRVNRLAKQLARSLEQNWLSAAGAADWRRLDRIGESENFIRNSTANEAGDAAAPAVPPPLPPAEEWRRRFGEFAATRFVFEVVSRVCRQSSLQGDLRSSLLSANDPTAFAAKACDAVRSMRGRSASLLNSTQPLAVDDEALVKKLASSTRVLTKLIDEVEKLSPGAIFDAASLDRLVAAECLAAVTDYLGRHTAAGANNSNATQQADTQQSLEKSNVDLLQCGYDRRTFALVPRSNSMKAACDALKTLRPTVHIIPTDAEEAVIFSEGAGISPTSFMLGFEHVYPGIAEAAGRLFTRIDIDWAAKG